MRQNWLWWLALTQTAGILLYVLHRHGRDLESRSTLAENFKHSMEFRSACASNKNSRLARLERFSNYNESTLTLIDQLIERKAHPRDPVLVDLVRHLMDPPAVTHTLKLSRAVYKTPQATAIDIYLKGKGGFFVEAGGYDGERSSNTLYFEATKDWSGLLIEADPFFYTQLLGKNRRCWSINACLSPSGHVSKLHFKDSDTGQGRVILEEAAAANRKQAAPVINGAGRRGGGGGGEQGEGARDKESVSLFSEEMIVPCFPLETMMAALRLITIDFFSLDVEGLELEILKSIDFEGISVETLAVEFAHGNKSALRMFMERRGYTVIDEINVVDYANFLFANDYIFARDSERHANR